MRNVINMLLFSWLLSGVSAAAYADTATDTKPGDTQNSNPVSSLTQSLSGQTFLLGAAYEFANFTFSRPNFAPIELTNAGSGEPVVDYVSPEKKLAVFHLRDGDSVIGFNISGSFSQIDMTRQTVNGGSGAGAIIKGQDLGSQVHSEYIAAAPFIYIRVGPISPGTDSYWLLGVGAGAGYWRTHGDFNQCYLANPIPIGSGGCGFNGREIPAYAPIDSGYRLSVYETARINFHYNDWDFLVAAKAMSVSESGIRYDLRDYSVGLAYNLRF